MNSTPRKRFTKTLASIAGLALLAVPLAACGSDDESSDGGSSSSARPEPIASITDLSTDKGTTAVKLDGATLEALGGLGVEPTPFGTATIEDGSIIFPITGGNVTVFEKDAVPRYVVGQVQHEGSGLSLTAGGVTVTVGNFNVDPTVSLVYGDVAVDGKVAATSIPILRLDGRTLKTPTFDNGEAVLSGSGVFLTDGAATLLNDTFGVDALSGSTKIGVATITANIPA
ncbi:hypothetical protein [Nocardioides sp.]|uniref:hypothetical protein n=1 Tax=Nocardioides sp. TaxID=35761 RepID=UPI0027270313|nr:hypothetical protein [Nocardioides sp.]MDO9458124.1 hypothetical protein [Nocardioides sp.]